MKKMLILSVITVGLFVSGCNTGKSESLICDSDEAQEMLYQSAEQNGIEIKDVKLFITIDNSKQHETTCKAYYELQDSVIESVTYTLYEK